MMCKAVLLRVAALLAGAALVGGCPATDTGKPVLEMVPVEAMLAHPQHGEAVGRELQELLDGQNPDDCRRTPTAVLSPAGYLCFVRIAARPADRQVLVQTVRVRRNLGSAHSVPSDAVYKLHVCWLNESGEGRAPFPLSWRADVAGRRRARIKQISEEQNIAFQKCRYPYAAPPLGRKRIAYTRSQEQIAARHQLIETEGDAALVRLQFASDLQTGAARLRLSGEGLEVALSNRAPVAPPPTTQPATQPSTQPAEPPAAGE